MIHTVDALRLSLVIPTFNETGNVKELLRRLEQCLGPNGWEVIFVDDDSPDGTAALVRSIRTHGPKGALPAAGRVGAAACHRPASRACLRARRRFWL